MVSRPLNGHLQKNPKICNGSLLVTNYEYKFNVREREGKPKTSNLRRIVKMGGLGEGDGKGCFNM